MLGARVTGCSRAPRVCLRQWGRLCGRPTLPFPLCALLLGLSPTSPYFLR